MSKKNFNNDREVLERLEEIDYEMSDLEEGAVFCTCGANDYIDEQRAELQKEKDKLLKKLRRN